MDNIKTYVITCNDSIEHIVIGTQLEASDKMRELTDQYYEHSFKGVASREDYRKRCHWSTRETPVTYGDGVAIFQP